MVFAVSLLLGQFQYFIGRTGVQNCARHGQVPKYCSEVNKDLRQQRRENVLEYYLNYNQYDSMREVADGLDTQHATVRNDLEWVVNNRKSADIIHHLQYVINNPEIGNIYSPLLSFSATCR